MAAVKRVLQTAAPLIPPAPTLPALRKAAASCKACDLWKRGTQTVFGEGARNAQVMLVGEQPGNDEDLAGHPFVGPAGKLLDRALEEAGIDRRQAYVTNVVKHFKWEPRGKRRIHAKPDLVEITACLPWLRAEVDLVKPRALVCLGAPAALTRAKMWISSPASAPTMEAPRTFSVCGSSRIFIVPAVWSVSTARAISPNAIVAVAGVWPRARASRSVRPIRATCGSVNAV